MACYWLFLFLVNMMKGRICIGSGVVVDQEKVHGHDLRQDEVALMVESLKVNTIKHTRCSYDIEVGGFSGWCINDVEVL